VAYRLSPLLDQSLGIGPQFADRQVKIFRHRCHYVACHIGLPALYFAQIERAVAQNGGQIGLGETLTGPKLRNSATKNLIWGSGLAPNGRSNGLTHAIMVRIGARENQQL
jgi:hypothetical protein